MDEEMAEGPGGREVLEEAGAPVESTPQMDEELGSFCTRLPPRRCCSSGELSLDVPSCGSIGHPHFCKLPCQYFQEGNCTLGANCGFCHRPHGARRERLEKQQREKVAKLTPYEFLDFLKELIRGKFPNANLDALQPIFDAFPPDGSHHHLDAMAKKCFKTQKLALPLHKVRRHLTQAAPELADEIDGAFDALQEDLCRQFVDSKTGLLTVITATDWYTHQRGKSGSNPKLCTDFTAKDAQPAGVPCRSGFRRIQQDTQARKSFRGPSEARRGEPVNNYYFQ